MYRLSTSVPYLIARLGIRTGDLFTQVIRQDGLTLQMYRVLAALTEESRALRLGELAALTSADLSTLSRVVAEMHRRGYVLRQRPETDQRSLQVSLTDLGRQLVGKYIPVASHYEKVAVGSLSPEATQALRTLLAELYQNIGQIEAQIADGTIQTLIEGGGKRRISRTLSDEREAAAEPIER